jgi:hypothetical protein
VKARKELVELLKDAGKTEDASREQRRVAELEGLESGASPGTLPGTEPLAEEREGSPQLAVRWLERGLAVPGRDEDERQALRYELGNALELAGQTQRALEVFTELYGDAAGHRDVAERVRRLRALRSAGEGT